MTRAKARGGDSWDVHAPRSRALAAERQATESALRRALVQNDLELFWQPVVECETGAIVSVESLLRWENPRAGADADFVSLADVAGLAVPLGHWTLRAACRQAHALARGRAPGPGALGQRLGETAPAPGACSSWSGGCSTKRLFRRPAWSSRSPRDEIRRQPERTIEHLAQLRKLGLRVALDDFGTGESRLGHLYRFPLDTLKIDGSVVAGATSSHDHEAVITAAVALARSRQLRVVAEGVETEAQRVLLVRWQCDRMQGSLCGPPAAADRDRAPAAAPAQGGQSRRRRRAGRRDPPPALSPGARAAAGLARRGILGSCGMT